MKIGIVTDEYSPPWDEGRKNIQNNLVQFLERRGESVFIISSSLISGSRSLPPLFYKFPFLRRIETFFIFRNILLKNKIDLLFNMLSAVPFFAMKAWIYEKFLDIPNFIYIPSIKRESIFNHCFLNPRRVFAGGEFINNYFPGSELVYPLLDVDNFRVNGRHISSPSKKKNILFLGAFQEERGLQFLLRAMADVVKDHEARLTIAWNGRGDYENEIRYLIKELDLEPHLTLKGNCLTPELYKEAYVVVIPRILGGSLPPKMFFPLRFVEAIASQTPLIVSDIYDWAKSIKKCGLVVPPGDVNALKRAIIKMITDETLYQSCVDACASQLENYHPDRILEKMLRIWKESIRI